MVGVAVEGELEARLADDGFDDGEGGVVVFEDGALLDVDFEGGEGVGGEWAGRGDVGRGSRPKSADGVGDGDAVGVGAGEVFGGELAGGGERGEEGEAEADAFLFGEGDELDVEGERGGAELLDGGEGEEDA